MRRDKKIRKHVHNARKSRRVMGAFLSFTYLASVFSTLLVLGMPPAIAVQSNDASPPNGAIQPSAKITEDLAEKVREKLETNPYEKIRIIMQVSVYGERQTELLETFSRIYNFTALTGNWTRIVLADVPAIYVSEVANNPLVLDMKTPSVIRWTPGDLGTATMAVAKTTSGSSESMGRTATGSIPREPLTETDTYELTTLETTMKSINVTGLWNQGYRGQYRKVAIIDTGINTTLVDGNPRPEFQFQNGASKIWKSYDFTNDNDPRDLPIPDLTPMGHGTYVAIIAAGSGRYWAETSVGNLTSQGPASESLILNLKALGRNMPTTEDSIIRAIDNATQNGADVINLSLAHLEVQDGLGTITIMVDDAVKQGITVCVAIGNSGPNPGTTEGQSSSFNCVTVGAAAGNGTDTISDDGLCDFSSRGPTVDGRTKPDVIALGYREAVLYYINESSGFAQLLQLDGTSFAAPQVTGTSALLKQINSTWNPMMVKKALMNTARLNSNLTNYAENDRGKGIIDAYSAKCENPVAIPVSLKVDSITPASPHWSIFETYTNWSSARVGMWIGFYALNNGTSGNPIVEKYSVTFERNDTSNIVTVIADVWLRRINANDESDYYDIPSSKEQINLAYGGTATETLTWNETALAPGVWNITAFISPNWTDYWNDIPSLSRLQCSSADEAKDLPGDATGSGMVDIFDAIRVANAFNCNNSSERWNPNADLNNDGNIDIFDAIILAGHFNQYIGDGYGTPDQQQQANERTGTSSLGSNTAVTVEPAQLVVFKDETFNMTVRIGGVTDLCGWEFQLYWNKTVINCTNVVVNTPTIWVGDTSEYGPGLKLDYNSTHSCYFKAQSRNYPASSFNGTIDIATFTFQALQPGATSLTLTDVKLGNSTGDAIDHTETSGSVDVYYGRYMRNDTATVNGLNAYVLNATETTSYTYVQRIEQGLGAQFGIRAWVRASNGTEYEVTLDGQTGTPKATVTGTGWGTVNVTQKTMQTTFSLVIRVYVTIADGPWTNIATFTTEQLGKTSLTGTTWSVYYRVSVSYSVKLDRTTARFYWGDASHMSRIQNLQYT